MSDPPEVDTRGDGEKRPRGSPTGETPLQTSKRRPTESALRSRAGTGRAGKSLFSPWTDAEESALIQFVLLTRADDHWPTEKSCTYWEGAAEFVCRAVSGCHKRSGEIAIIIVCTTYVR